MLEPVKKAGFSEVKNGSRSKNAVAQFIGLPLLLLRGARFLAYASEQAPQSREGTGDCRASLAMTKSVVLDESSFNGGKE